jgi:hypothetical protein
MGTMGQGARALFRCERNPINNDITKKYILLVSVPLLLLDVYYGRFPGRTSGKL